MLFYVKILMMLSGSGWGVSLILFSLWVGEGLREGIKRFLLFLSQKTHLFI